LTALKSQRIKKVKPLIKEENFFLAYGDDIADIDLGRLFALHLKAGATVTITAVKMFSIFGVVDFGKNAKVAGFKEKPYLNKWMSGGFMVMNRKIFDYFDAGELETGVFDKLASQGKLYAYKHPGQWKTMNTLKDNIELNAIWKKKNAFWKKWR
jgi:glucose-1-phosphate cytidylyltransferase